MKFSKLSAIICFAFVFLNSHLFISASGNNFYTPPHAMAAGPASVADLAERLIGAVVNISTSQNVDNEDEDHEVPRPEVEEDAPFQDFFDEFFNPETQKNSAPQPRKVQSLGSGFVIDSEGIIITNNHVIADADVITVEFTDGSELTAEVLGADAKTDIAVLKVQPEKPLKAVSFGPSSKARVGDWVMAIGNPFGQGSSVTLGIVSAINRDIQSGPYDSFIQTDAAINRGNSGGPLFNMKGDVIGINTAIISPSGGSIGLGFSVPSDLAVKVIHQLREFGETRRGWLGVSIQPVTNDIAKELSLTLARGALVAGLSPKGPAESSGIQIGDVILKFDGKAINQMRDLPRIVAATEVAKAVDVIVFRDGKRQTISVVLGRLENDETKAETDDHSHDDDGDKNDPIEKMEQDTRTYQAMGLAFSELTKAKRSTFAIDSEVMGVLIEKVAAGSQAAEKGIETGDVVTAISQEKITTLDDVKDHIANLRKAGRNKALLLVAKADGQLSFHILNVE